MKDSEGHCDTVWSAQQSTLQTHNKTCLICCFVLYYVFMVKLALIFLPMKKKNKRTKYSSPPKDNSILRKSFT